MAKVGAQRAAELTGVSKSTVQRAMKAGKLSFELDSNQRRLIDVSELERVFGLKPQNQNSSTQAAAESVNVAPDYTVMLELEKARHELELERVRMELRMAQEQLDGALTQIEDLKVQRDLWQKQAQQILITSQYTQKQSEERISEFREREEARQRIIEQRRSAGAPVQHTGARSVQNAASSGVSSAKVQPAPIQAQGQSSATNRATTQASAPSQAPVFRTVQTSNQNRTEEKQSLFAALFGAKKKA